MKEGYANGSGWNAAWQRARKCRLTRERGLVFDVDVLILAVPFNGFLQTFEALHEGRY